MLWSRLTIPVGISALQCAAAAAAANLGAPGGQQVLGGEAVDFNCDLPPLLDPSRDGLPSAADLFSGRDALLKQVERHGALVRVPSVSYDDNGEPGEDPRWDVFYELHDTLASLYPSVHARSSIAHVNTFGLVYTIQGRDASLKPLMLAAHQDVVPVADPSTWRYPPFSGHFDGRWLWGRGASDDKNSLTALMSALEALLANASWAPQRTVLLALGFDEECSGRRGAGTIGPYLEALYGKDSMALLLDEGGMGLELLEGDTLYALPAVMEKGHVDIWLDLSVNGGHSSIPYPHTGIGIMSELVVAIEAHPYAPKLVPGSPVHNHLVCQARYSPDAAPTVTKLLRDGDLAALAAELAAVDRPTRYRLQTSQAVDYFRGGVKINAMPERVRLGVNHRVAPHDSIAGVKAKLLRDIGPVVEKYGLALDAFSQVPGGTFQDNTDGVVALEADDLFTPATTYQTDDFNGTLVLTTSQETLVAPVSPTAGKAWDVFSGTIQHTFAFAGGRIVPVGELMTGNTDTRHYQGLTPNIYRWAPTRKGGNQNGHTVDEGVDMYAHMEAVSFYYDLVRNFDASDA